MFRAIEAVARTLHIGSKEPLPVLGSSSSEGDAASLKIHEPDELLIKLTADVELRKVPGEAVPASPGPYRSSLPVPARIAPNPPWSRHGTARSVVPKQPAGRDKPFRP